MKVKVREIKTGKIKTLPRMYAEIYVKTKKYTYVQEAASPFSKPSFKDTVVSKPITAKDTITKKETEKKVFPKVEDKEKTSTSTKATSIATDVNVELKDTSTVDTTNETTGDSI